MTEIDLPLWLKFTVSKTRIIIMSNNKNTFDAIVIGTGISGGWAAKELCEAGLKTLVLERGKNIEHITDYKTANKETWE